MGPKREPDGATEPLRSAKPRSSFDGRAHLPVLGRLADVDPDARADVHANDCAIDVAHRNSQRLAKREPVGQSFADAQHEPEFFSVREPFGQPVNLTKRQPVDEPVYEPEYDAGILRWGTETELLAGVQLRRRDVRVNWVLAHGGGGHAGNSAVRGRDFAGASRGAR